jgi:DNA-binding transcriptional MerR regulator
MTTIDQSTKSWEEIMFKIGAVSELTSIPVTTLRDWEIRYKALVPNKTKGRHRMYRQSDIDRAHLFKRLTSLGQSISSIANLQNTELESLLARCHCAKADVDGVLSAHEQPINQQGAGLNLKETFNLKSEMLSMPVVVIGLGLARRLESPKFTRNLQNSKLKMVHVYMDIASALGDADTLTPKKEREGGLIIVSQDQIHEKSVPELTSLALKYSKHQLIVLYQYAPTSCVEELRSKGLMLKREPITDSDLAQLLQSFLFIESRNNISKTNYPVSADTLSLISPRKYSRETLDQLSALSTSVFCECPHHVCEILGQLASFEKYSQECLSNSSEDADMHSYLSSVSGSARILFEQALEKIVEYEGLQLPQV